MIKCYAITHRDHLGTLQQHCELYPLTKLVGHHADGTVKLKELLDMGVNVVFVDYLLKQQFKASLEKLASTVLFVYLSENFDHVSQALEDGAIDYLTYSSSFKRFEFCMNKIVRASLLLVQQPKRNEPKVMDSIFIRSESNRKMEVLINCRDVVYIEAFQNEVAIQMSDGRKLQCCHTMKEMEDNLPSCFLRVHKSFIINCSRITSFDGNAITLEGNNFTVPLGGMYKKIFLDRRNTMVIRKADKTLELPIYAKTISFFAAYFTADYVFIADALLF